MIRHHHTFYDNSFLMTTGYDPRLFLFFVLHPTISQNLLGINVDCPRVDARVVTLLEFLEWRRFCLALGLVMLLRLL